MSDQLQVAVTPELILDAGWWEESLCDDEICRRLHPPAETMFDQILAYLHVHADDERPSMAIADQARVATAVCLRWGTYLAVVLDPEKPVMPEVKVEGLSRLANSEMKRINIESSYALARWIEIMNTDYRGRYQRLLAAAQRLLPLPPKSLKRAVDFRSLLALASPTLAQMVLDARLNSQGGQDALQAVHEAPYRVLANALMNGIWRNGPVEDIHAGRSCSYPIRQRRTTDKETRLLMRETSERMINGLYGVHALIEEMSDRSLVDKVLPYALVPDLLVTPTDWTIREVTSEVCLPGREP
jgi:hypothetical protein